MPEFLIPRRSLFRFALPCRYRETLWTEAGTALGEEYRLVDLAGLEGRPGPADVRFAWNEEGVAFRVCQSGKRRQPWCRIAQPEESEGLHVWIDTRDVHNVHRANRFCHRFVFLPGGDGPKNERPVAEWLPINRAREHPRSVDASQLRLYCQRRPDGYLLEGLIPAGVLTGFDPAEHPRLGFNYAVLDRERGEQTLSAGSPLPYQEDPSLWATLELVRAP